MNEKQLRSREGQRLHDYALSGNTSIVQAHIFIIAGALSYYQKKNGDISLEEIIGAARNNVQFQWHPFAAHTALIHVQGRAADIENAIAPLFDIDTHTNVKAFIAEPKALFGRLRKTMKMNNREELISFLNDYYYMDALRDYALLLQAFFLTEAQLFTRALCGGHDNTRDQYAQELCERDYHLIGDVKYIDVREALEDLDHVTRWINNFDSYIERIMKAEADTPLIVEGDDDDDDREMMGRYIGAFDARYNSGEAPFYSFHPERLMVLRAQSAGLTDPDRYREMIRFYN